MEKNPAARSFRVPSYGAKQAIATIVRVLLGVAVGLIIWEICSLIFNANGSTLGFPDPLSAFQRLGEYLFAGRPLYGHSIYEHIGTSIKRLLIAFVMAALVGIILGSLMGYFQRFYAIAIVPVAIYQMIPGLAWLPVAILMFGLGDDSADMQQLTENLVQSFETAAGNVVPRMAVIIGTLISNAQLVMVNDQMVELRSTLSDLQDQETQLKAQYELSYDLQDIERQLLASGEMMKAQSWQIYTLELSEPDAVEYHQAWDLPQKLLSMAKEFSTAVREYF